MTTTTPDAAPSQSVVDAGCAALELAPDRETVTRILVASVLPQASLTVLFLVRGEMGMALAASGTTLGEAEVTRLVLPLTASPLLLQASAGEVAKASARTDPLQQVIASYLQGPTPTEACVAPIAMGKRVVNLLCVQTAAGATFPDGSIDELRRLATHAGAAYARIIRQLKQKD